MRNTKKLDKILGIEDEDMSEEEYSDEIVEEENKTKAPVLYNTQDNVPISEEEKASDLQYSRKSMQSIVDRAQKILELSIKNIEESGTDRSIEVATEAVNSAVNASEKLVDLHDKLEKLKISREKLNGMGSGNSFVQNQTVVHLTTAELLDKLTAPVNTDVNSN